MKRVISVLAGFRICRRRRGEPDQEDQGGSRPKSSHVTTRRAILSASALAASLPHCHGLPSRRQSCPLSGASIP